MWVLQEISYFLIIKVFLNVKEIGIINAEATELQLLTIAAPEKSLSRLFREAVYPCPSGQAGFSGGFFCGTSRLFRGYFFFHKKK